MTAFVSSHGMAAEIAVMPPEFGTALRDAHYPAALSGNRRLLKRMLNTLPRQDADTNRPLREELFAAIAEKLPADRMRLLVASLANGSAQRDLLEKRISEMTPAQFISDVPYAYTRTDASGNKTVDLEAAHKEVIEPDYQRFAKVLPKAAGNEKDEWADFDDPEPAP